MDDRFVAQYEFYADWRDTDATKAASYPVEVSPHYQYSDATHASLTWRHGLGGKEMLHGTTLLNSEERDIGILT